MPVLYLVPTPIADHTIDKVLPEYVISVIHSLKQFVVEDFKAARRFLSKLKHPLEINQLKLMELNEHSKVSDIQSLLPSLLAENTGVLSEAGLPCLADPGSTLVHLAHENNIKVIPLTGPSSIFMALISSGLNGQSFSFAGYLPVKRNERQARLRVLEKRSAVEKQTQIFIETPYRNMLLLEDILYCCKSDTMLTIAAGITGVDEYILTQSIKMWKAGVPDLKKRPTVFLLQA